MTYQSDKYCNGDYQQAVAKMWSDNCLQMCNEFISHLQTNQEHDYTEEVMNVSGGDDWESAAIDAGWSQYEDEYGANCYKHEDGTTYAAHDWQELCEEHNIDPYPIEVFQYFIVSDWLAARLQEKEELVEDDIMGFTIWGRTCCGQAVYLDKVICDIYDEQYGNNWKGD